MLVLLSNLLPAAAEQIQAPGPADEPAQTTAQDATLLAYVLSDLTARKQVLTKKLLKKRQTLLDDPEAKWIHELAVYYAEPQSVTAWVDRSGFLPRSEAVIKELMRAADYGLEPSRYAVPPLPEGRKDLQTLAAAEVHLSLALARYAYHARGGRFDPTELSLWLDYKPRPPSIGALNSEISRSTDIQGAIHALHPNHPQFEALRQALLKEREPVKVPAGQVIIPMGERIKPGQRHPDVVLVRQRLAMPSSNGEDALLDPDLADAIAKFMLNAGMPYGRRRGIDDGVRLALNGGRRAVNKENTARINQILANMERWRWLPRDLGETHIWNNLPEFETRVVKQGRVIHSERIIIGETQSQTPIFSDSMTRVIFKPDWTVPESIKLSSFWGSLRSGDYAVLQRRNMRIVHEGKEIKPHKIKWESVNARDVPIVQGPGSGNPLGDFKFVFPNKHDVYMHDTTSKHLFEASERTFSHGCIRVRNPQRFAEVILAEGKSWSRADVAWQARTKSTVRIELDRAIPIHNTYFTLVADASGNLRAFKDMYRHDKRIIDALNGVDPKRIGASDPARALIERNRQLAAAPPIPQPLPAVQTNSPAGLFSFKPLTTPTVKRTDRPESPFSFAPAPSKKKNSQGVPRALSRASRSM
jgi:murein L,D-transpeptidase YcbB/YkuD